MSRQQQWSAILAIVPIFISLSFISAISLVDIFLAGLLGPEAQAALGIADQIVFLNMVVINGLCAGVNAAVSRSYGAGDQPRATLYIRHSVLAGAVVGLLGTTFGYFAADCIAAAFTAESGVRLQAAMYIRLVALGNLPWALVTCQGAIFRASGKARLCVFQWFVITVLCVGLELIAFFLLAGCRSLVPLAVAWDFSILVGCLLGAGSLRQLQPAPKKLSVKLFLSDARSILAVGLPVVAGDLCWLISNLLLFRLLSLLPHATVAEAAWTVQLKIEETIACVPLMAFCQTTAALTGSCVGAGDPAGARQIAKRLARIALVAMFVVGCITALTAPYVVQWASGDEEVRQIAKHLLIGSIVTFPINALALVLASAMEGAGSTVLPMSINVVALMIVRLPLAWIFSVPLGAGMAGLWIAKCISNFIALAGMAFVYKRWDWLVVEESGAKATGRNQAVQNFQLVQAAPN